MFGIAGIRNTVPRDLLANAHRARRRDAAPAPTVSEPTDVEEAERAWLLAALRKHGDNRSAVARELGMARSSLLYKLRRYGLM